MSAIPPDPSVSQSYRESRKDMGLLGGAHLTNRLDNLEEIVKVTERVYSYVKGDIKTHSVIPTDKRLVGKGAEGSVYASKDHGDIVVKKYHHRDIEKAKEDLKKTIELDHPNLNKSHFLIIKHYHSDGVFKMKLVMDRAEGKTLFSMNLNGEKYDDALREKIFAQLKSILTYTVNKNYFWADLNIGNVFLTKDGNIKFIDFAEWGKHSRFSKRALVGPQLKEAIKIFETLISLSNANNTRERLDRLSEKKEEWLAEVENRKFRDPDEYLKEKIDDLYTLAVEGQ